MYLLHITIIVKQWILFLLILMVQYERMIIIKHEERIKKLNSLSQFINGEHQDDILLMLRKNFKENKWNVICSAMHWFRTIEMHLDSTHILDYNEKDYNWGKVYVFLSAVDIVIEGINDINKIAKNNDRARLFFGDNEIFKDKEKDDWEYFKNIRAIFGAHPTKLRDNKEYIVSTYPTPYNPNAIVEKLKGKPKEWDYYTILWSKEKSDNFNELSFGFKFKDVEKYLDKCINYLDIIYSDILNMIYEYKQKISKQAIEKKDNPIEQLNTLLEEDNSRLNGRYNYDINKMKVLIETQITDKSNEMEYQKYREILINKIPDLYNAIQNPDKIDNIDEILSIIDCYTEYFTSKSSYYYQKLYEYWNNENMEELLIQHFSNKIKPFNNNITNIKELYCLVIAYNYFRSSSKK